MLKTIERAISNSHKTRLKLKDGQVWKFHPYFILKRYDGRTVLRGFVEADTASCDIAMEQVAEAVELTEDYAVAPSQDAVIELLRNSFNPEELRDLEIQRLCGLVERVQCAYLTYTNAQEAARQIVTARIGANRPPDRAA